MSKNNFTFLLVPVGLLVVLWLALAFQTRDKVVGTSNDTDVESVVIEVNIHSTYEKVSKYLRYLLERGEVSIRIEGIDDTGEKLSTYYNGLISRCYSIDVSDDLSYVARHKGREIVTMTLTHSDNFEIRLSDGRFVEADTSLDAANAIAKIAKRLSGDVLLIVRGRQHEVFWPIFQVLSTLSGVGIEWCLEVP